jgi:acyl-CoA reductase-like NAD-dependent aldehyde dehydrogenase
MDLMNFVAGGWQPGGGGEAIPVTNPATGRLLARVPQTPAGEVDRAARAAAAALPELRRLPAPDRLP